MNMTKAFKLTEMQRTNIEFERQRHLANWLVKSSPHMAAAAAAGAAPSSVAAANAGPSSAGGGAAAAATTTQQQGAPGNSSTVVAGAAACNGAHVAGGHQHQHQHQHHGHMAAEARKAKLRRFNSHDTSSNMFSVADFENARLARRNEIELKQRLARRLRNSGNGSYGLGAGGYAAGYNGGFCGALNGSGDYSTGDSKTSKCSSESQQEPLPADVFLERHSLPRVVRISYSSKTSNETLQSSSSHGSSTTPSSNSSAGIKQSAIGTVAASAGTATHSNDTATTSTSSGGSGSAVQHSSPANTTSTSSTSPQQPPINDELFLLYRLVRQRHIYHGHNAKSQAAQRKKTLLIPQEFPGYFSVLNDKGLPMATQYNSLMQLVRERVYKFASVDSMAAFTESTPSTSSPTHEGCLPSYTTSAATKGRPQYIKTTARGGQVFRLLAVFEDGKQEQQSAAAHMAASGNLSGSKAHVHMGREKEKGRYAQLLNENRQVMYVPLATKGKFYEIEPGIPQLLQKVGDANRKLNPECVHKLGALVSAAKQLPLTLRYISGQAGGAHDIPEQLCISQVSKEDIVIGCPIEDVELQSSLQLRKLYVTREMQLLKSFLGFDCEQRMLANANVQNMLKFCQFNCDQFLKLVELEVVQRPERSGSKSRVDGLKILKPLHLPKLLRREKSSMAAHEKEDSIIFLSKTDLEQLEAKEAAAAAAVTSGESGGSNRITERMKVFQSTKKKWFRKQGKQPDIDLDVQAKRMSMERYTDMSKLLQERFGNATTPEQRQHQQQQRQSQLQQEQEHEALSLSLHSGGTSDVGCSDTETTTLTTIERSMPMPKSLDTLLQKSMSLQDIELLNGQRKPKPQPDLLATHRNGTAADTISEAGTELEDVENQSPQPPHSFITEKLYNEFHVKTRQYSKSSSSLHQLLNFSMPQKLQLHERERQWEREKRSLAQRKAIAGDFSIGEPVTGRRAAGGVSLLAGGMAALPHVTLLIEDDLPYSSVRDSLVVDSSCSASAGGSRDAVLATSSALPSLDYTKENIYAEICHEGGIGGLRLSQTCDTQLTQISNSQQDDGDYASLKYRANGPQSVSRVEINCSTAANAISYHTVYLGEEALSERNGASALHVPPDRVHITTVELAGEDNIYNTLK